MDEQKLDRLRALAEKATSGPWFSTGNDLWVEGETGGQEMACCGDAAYVDRGECCGNGIWADNRQQTQEQIGQMGKADAEYVAELDPAFIIELIEAVRARDGC